MKVAFVNQPMDMLVPPDQNSIGIWTFKTAPHVAKRHEVVVFGKRSAAQRAWNGDDGVHYEFVPPAAPNRRIIRSLEAMLDRVKDGHLPSYASRLAYLDYATQIAWKARRFGADIIHIHNFSQFVPTLRRLNPGAKIVLHMSCEWLNQLDREVVDRRLQQTDLVVGCSDYITQKVKDRFPHHAGRCVTVDNGVDIDRFVPSDGPESVDADPGRRLLFVGRVSPEKGVHDLIQAFVKVAAEIPHVRLDLAGPVVTLPKEFILDVSDEDEVADLARFYATDYGDHLRGLVPADLADRVSFLGAMPQDELVGYYRVADIVVNPSYSESFGMSLVEAQACGTPVVATRVGGMVGIVGDDEEVGLLVERGDVDGLSAGLLRLLRDDELRQRMGATGRARVVDRFGWDQVAESLMRQYARLDASTGV